MIIAYYRVSTDRQGRSGLGLEAQRAAVEEYARRAGRPVAESYTEVESGRRCDRPKLAAAVAHARLTRGGELVVAKLDRLSRDTGFTLALLDSGVRVKFLDLPDIGSDPITSRLVLTVMAAFAEFEGRRIGQRIKEALARYKARGGVLGTRDPRVPGRSDPGHMRRVSAAGHAAQRARADDYRRLMRPVAAAIREGRTLAETAAELNSRGFSTRRGKAWTPAGVDVLLRAGS